ncbi:MAG TPA: dienelactone hydrolase family protein [Streptosporangiaceae bacterium]|nr:dienelactone hydrolase family protein [Streptosporangiaceae bacterium]
MPRLDVEIPAADGSAAGTLHVPDGTGPWPGVLVFPDAGGARETMRVMADRLAGMGYVALVPDIYYRAGGWEPFDVATLFTDSQERARMSTLAGPLTNDRIIADAGYDPAAEARHWDALRDLYQAHLSSRESVCGT